MSPELVSKFDAGMAFLETSDCDALVKKGCFVFLFVFTSSAAGKIVQAGSQWLENSVDLVDFHQNVQCAGFCYFMC